MRLALAASLVAALLALPARAGDLIHYRTPSGETWVTNDPKTVPPDATILGRMKPAAEAAAAGADGAAPPATPSLPPAPPAPLPPAAALRPDGDGLDDPPTAEDPDAEPGDRPLDDREPGRPFGSDGDDTPEARAEATWRARRAQAEEDFADAKRELDRAQAAYDDCRKSENAALRMDVARVLDSTCPEGDLEAARAAFDRAQAYLEDGLEDDCRRNDCLPGWVRGD